MGRQLKAGWGTEKAMVVEVVMTASDPRLCRCPGTVPPPWPPASRQTQWLLLLITIHDTSLCFLDSRVHILNI